MIFICGTKHNVMQQGKHLNFKTMASKTEFEQKNFIFKRLIRNI